MIRPRYFFRSLSNRFLYVNVKVFDVSGEMIGFVMLKVRDSGLSVPYAYFERERAADILYVIIRHAIDMGLKWFETFNQALINSLSLVRIPRLSKRRLSRRFIVSKRFRDVDFESYHLQDGDADCVLA